MTLVADTSSLVSLGSVDGNDPSPLSLLFEHYQVTVPQTVIEELEEISQKSQTDKAAAESVLSRKDRFDVHEIDPDIQRFDPGERAAIALTEEINASYFLCDEFTNVMAIHASLGETQLVTTPNLLKVLFKRGNLSKKEAIGILKDMSESRSWQGNSYVNHCMSWFKNRG